jgi:hypothetical protein
METRGRKAIPKETKKIPVTIYMQAQEIEKMGGMQNCKNELLNFSKTKFSHINNCLKNKTISYIKV